MSVQLRSTMRREHITPEGPYEGARERAADLTYNQHMVDVIDFMSELGRVSRTALHLSVDHREIGIVLNLVRDHFNGRLTTMSSLVAGSGMTYGTAHRTIVAMMIRGLIVKRERTATGKSYSLHPSSKMLRGWQDLARVARAMAEVSLLPAKRRKLKPRGGPAIQRGIIPTPSVLNRKLSLSRGLRLLVHADPTFMAMKALKQQFEMILGITINARALSIDRLRREIVANSQRNVSAYDIVACDLPWFGEMVSRNRLLPLDPYIEISKLDLTDFIPDAIASTRRSGQQYGIPILSTSEMLFYRTDMFDAAGIGEPRTTDDVITAARELNAPTKGISGIAWNGGRGTALGHSFIVIMASHGQPIVNLAPTPDGFAAEDAAGENLRPMFLSPQARATGEFLSELLEFSPPNILSMTWFDRAQCYAEGHAAMAYFHTLLANLCELDEASPAFRNTGYLPPPSGMGFRPVSHLGGYSLAIPRNIAAERVPAVWTAMETLTSAGATKLFVANGSLANPRFSVNKDPEIAGLSPVIGMVDDMARRGVLRVWPRPSVPGISSIIAIAGQEIHDFLQGEKTLDRALIDAQNRADRAMRERGHY